LPITLANRRAQLLAVLAPTVAWACAAVLLRWGWPPGWGVLPRVLLEVVVVVVAGWMAGPRIARSKGKGAFLSVCLAAGTVAVVVGLHLLVLGVGFVGHFRSWTPRVVIWQWRLALPPAAAAGLGLGLLQGRREEGASAPLAVLYGAFAGLLLVALLYCPYFILTVLARDLMRSFTVHFAVAGAAVFIAGWVAGWVAGRGSRGLPAPAWGWLPGALTLAMTLIVWWALTAPFEGSSRPGNLLLLTNTQRLGAVTAPWPAVLGFLALGGSWLGFLSSRRRPPS